MNVDDRATQQEEFARDAALKHRKHELQFKGNCYNCGEFVLKPAKFCDEFCREDYLIRNPNLSR